MITKKILLVCFLIIMYSIHNLIDSQRDPFFLPESSQDCYVQKNSEVKVQVHGIIEHKGVKSALVSDSHVKHIVSLDPGNTRYNLAQSSRNNVQILSKDEQLCLRVDR